MLTKNNSGVWQKLIRLALATALILMVPLVAMQFTDEVDWDSIDFAVMGILLFSTGLAYVLGTRNVSNVKRRKIIAAVLAVIFLFIWAELAVGVIGTPFAGQ